MSANAVEASFNYAIITGDNTSFTDASVNLLGDVYIFQSSGTIKFPQNANAIVLNESEIYKNYTFIGGTIYNININNSLITDLSGKTFFLILIPKNINTMNSINVDMLAMNSLGIKNYNDTGAKRSLQNGSSEAERTFRPMKPITTGNVEGGNDDSTIDRIFTFRGLGTIGTITFPQTFTAVVQNNLIYFYYTFNGGITYNIYSSKDNNEPSLRDITLNKSNMINCYYKCLIYIGSPRYLSDLMKMNAN